MNYSQIGLKTLVTLCRRLAMALHAGLDLRKTLHRESTQGRSHHRRIMQQIASCVDRGDSLTDALAETGSYFPRFFRAMVRLGEQSGRLDRILEQLANHYEHRLHIRRVFLSGILWPVIQLILAIVAIGVLILILGSLGDSPQNDILGFGLTGGTGLAIYLTIVGIGFLLLAALLYIASRETVSSRIQYLLMYVPGIRKALEILAMSRFAWALALAHDAGASMPDAISLAVRTTNNDYYLRHEDALCRAIRSGEELRDVLHQTGAFPAEVIDTVDVGEQGGQLSEALEKLGSGYQSQAKDAATKLAVLGSVGVWLVVASILIVMIFRVFSAYLGILESVGVG